jgi:ribosome silencing factor RsfS/YbeB/iojap
LPARDPPRYSRAVSSKRTWTRSELPTALERALGAAIERGARAPVILRLTEIAGYTDWVLLVSARSERQVRGVVDGVIEALASSSETSGARLIGTDGLDHYLWALLDYDDFLIHVFYHPVRKHYDLESMWSDAPRVELGLPADVMDLSDLEGLAAPEPMPRYRGDLSFGGFDDEFADEELDEHDELDDEDEPFEDGDEEDEDEAPGLAPSEPPAEATSPDDDLFEP